MKKNYKKLDAINFEIYTQNINHRVNSDDIDFKNIKNILKVQEIKGKKKLINKGGKLILCSDGTTNKNKINVIGNLLGLGNDINKIELFFDKVGFLFPISNTKPEQIDFEVIIALLNRIKSLVKLIELLYCEKTDYQEILNNFFYLMLSKPIEINSENFSYQSFNLYFFNKIKKLKIIDFSKKEESPDYIYAGYIVEDSLYKKETILDAFSIYKDLHKLNTLKNAEHQYNNENLFGIIFNAYMYFNTIKKRTEYISPFSTAMSRLTPQYESKPFVFNNQTIKTEFCSYKLLIDFLFNFEYKVGIIKESTFDNKLEFINPPEYTKFDDLLKKGLIDAAKKLVSLEINYNIKDINIYLDMEKNSLFFGISSLLSGIYFSLAQNNFSEEKYIKCANENCSNYVLVKKEDTSNKFCCNKCANAAAQRTYRLKHKDKI